MKRFFMEPWVIGIGGSAVVVLIAWLLKRLFGSKKNQSGPKPSIIQQAKVDHGGNAVQVAGDYHHTEKKTKSTSKT